MDNGNESAFPWDDKNGDGSHYQAYSGMTKREEIAKHLMAAMMGSYCRKEVAFGVTLQKCAAMAVEGAEYLLVELAKEQNNG